MTYSELRAYASDKCKKNSGTLAVITLIYIILSSGGTVSSESDSKWFLLGLLLSLIYLLIYGPIYYGYIYVIKKNCDKQIVEVKDLFKGFSRYSFSFVLELLRGIYVFLWSLLFVIPGIIKGCAYSMSNFIALENPELSANECITRSKEMMDGHKWDYFCLRLSYIGWYILSALTLGILSFWVMPKVETASYLFYKSIKKTNEVTEIEY